MKTAANSFRAQVFSACVLGLVIAWRINLCAFSPFAHTPLPTLAVTAKKFTSAVNRMIDFTREPASVFPILEDHLDRSLKEALVLDLGPLLCWYWSVTLSPIDLPAALLRLMDWLAACSWRPICQGALDLVGEEHHYVPIMDGQRSHGCVGLGGACVGSGL